MKTSLSDHYTYKKIFFATIASILMMIFTSLYSMADGLFLANFCATDDAFAGVNLIWPYIMILAGVGFMLGTGGSALVAKELGEQKQAEARRHFSFLAYASIVVGLVLAAIGYFTVEPFSRFMASLSQDGSEVMIQYAIRYGKILSLGVLFWTISNVFSPFFVTAERPMTGFYFVLAAGITNIVLDALLVGLLRLEVEGAAIATITGQAIAAIGPFIYFCLKKDLNLRLGKAKFEGKVLLRASSNGCSEFVTNIAGSIVSTCMNAQLLSYIPGSVGVSAYGIVMYVSFVFIAIFLGYSAGMAPIAAYNYGAQNHEELHNVFKKSIILIGVAGAAMFTISQLLGPTFVSIFANGSKELMELGDRAMFIYNFVYLTAGFSIFASAFFTALNNGIISAIISLVRSLGFELASLFLLPLLWQADGIWAAPVFAEIGSTIMTVIFFVTMQKKYHY